MCVVVESFEWSQTTAMIAMNGCPTFLVDIRVLGWTSATECVHNVCHIQPKAIVRQGNTNKVRTEINSI